MVIPEIKAAISLARSALPCKASGIWGAVRAHVEGRNAVNLERERRTTLLTVPSALPPGTEVYDLRADGSLLQLLVPPKMRIDAFLRGNVEQDTRRAAIPMADQPGQTSAGEYATLPAGAEE